jgi:hypothetical protein
MPALITVCSSTIIDYLFQRCDRYPRLAVAYFYFDFSDTRKQNARDLLCSLVAQICHQRADIPETVNNFYHKYRDGRMVPPFAELISILSASIDTFDQVYIILDAVDECSSAGSTGGRSQVLEALKVIHEWLEKSIHILVTSRKEIDIERTLHPLLTEESVNVRNFIDQDIKVCIKNELASARFQHWPLGVVEEVESSLIHRADGM